MRITCENIRTFHGCEVRIEKSIWGSLFGITRQSLFGILVMPNSDPEGQILLSAPSSHDTIWSPAFNFNVGDAIKESRSAILECDVAIMPTPNILKWQSYTTSYTTNVLTTCVVVRFLSHGRIRVCKIRFVSPGENCGKPCLVCKKAVFWLQQTACWFPFEIFCFRST